MTEVLDSAPIIEAAQQAAAAGDFVEAERLLREAAALQEARLGALHPDLASTLNNLALVCERTNKVDEAERLYRRARAIAVASLSPGHPFIATSLKNLVDFCAAHEIPIWRPPAAVRSEDETTSQEPETEAQPEQKVAIHSNGRTWPRRTIALATLAAAVVVAVVFAVQGRGITGTPAPIPQSQNISPGDSPVSSATTPALAREPQPTVTVERRADTTPAPVERPKPREASITPAPVSVLNAQLCSAIDKSGSPDWQCTSLKGDAQPGTYVFYTRLLTKTNTTVEHRWYRGERIHQVRRLRVEASPGTGYRTFSSTTVSPERAGDWKVELRAADGTLLREERFVVR